MTTFEKEERRMQEVERKQKIEQLEKANERIKTEIERLKQELEQEPHIPGFYDPTVGDYWIDGREHMQKSPGFIQPDEHFGKRESTRERSLALMEWLKLSKPHGRCPNEGEECYLLTGLNGQLSIITVVFCNRYQAVLWLCGVLSLDRDHIQKVVDHLNANPWLVGK